MHSHIHIPWPHQGGRCHPIGGDPPATVCGAGWGSEG
ncbi:hypothetical protein EI555_014327 [Monodon monoceros]|uniref:Uncharacterized protein n=1 Tax=Monodon monoceros TaxID=40151 RepID=A0A4U1FKB2_MONMO|nr:hypothetical protein EI555_014327 [Monodon monoceros]